ncbi:pentapeptide repeat-containing protein [Streptomyces collinus]|uniref:pentapeptide repeat-containing protein n=1 Tax=Streptomyces collinus TaxID=42684 RepID=UPI00381E7A52
MTPPWPPPWDHCDVATPDPCSGARIGSHTKCLAHLAPADRATYLADLVPGADINLCGTRITAALLGQLLAAVRLDGRPRLGEVDFSHTDFPDGADFINVDFTGSNANFYLASFAGLACFNGSLFTRGVNFHDTTFSEAVFLGMIVNGTASFVGARFCGDARLESVTCRHVLGPVAKVASSPEGRPGGVRCVLSAYRPEVLVPGVLGLSGGAARVRAGRRTAEDHFRNRP